MIQGSEVPRFPSEVNRRRKNLSKLADKKPPCVCGGGVKISRSRQQITVSIAHEPKVPPNVAVTV